MKKAFFVRIKMVKPGEGYPAGSPHMVAKGIIVDQPPKDEKPFRGRVKTY